MIGLIFECGPQGADKQVCEYLIGHIRPGTVISSRVLNTKRELLQDAGRVAAKLLKEGCDCVMIVWDLRPAWPDKNDKPCRALERQQTLDTLTQAGVPANAPIYPVCVEQELESWLIACDHAISAFLSTKTHTYTAKKVRKPDRERQPKAVMNNHFKAARGWVYDDRTHAIAVLKSAPLELKKLRRSESFARFEAKLSGVSQR